MANLIDVNREFGTEEQCLAYLEAARWPSGVACLKCGSLKVSKAVSTVKNRRTGEVSKTRYVYDCREEECKHQFSATTGTLFHDSHLRLTVWFNAIAILCNAKKSVSALQMGRDLGIKSYHTVWYLNHRIRKAMEQDGGLFTGTIEIDETYVGGKYDKRRKRGPWKKQAVVGMLQRETTIDHSKVRSFPVEKASAKLLTGAVRANVSKAAEMICTDESQKYKNLEADYRREVTNHIKKQYAKYLADGKVISTNGIEGFWSLFKRSVVGQFHHVSVKYLPKYLDETVYKFNNREAADLFEQTVTRLLESIPMPLAKLVSE